MTAAHASAEEYIPGPLGRRFSRVPLGLIASAHERGLPIKWAVLLALHAYCGEEEGMVWASNSRAEVCALLGITEGQERSAVRALIGDGLLSVLVQGHNGRSTVYRVNAGGPAAVPETPSTPVETPPTTLKTPPTVVNTPPTQLPETGVARGSGKGELPTSPCGPVGGAPETPPNRTLEEGSIGEPSPSEGLSGAGGREDAWRASRTPRHVTNLEPAGHGPNLADMFRNAG